MSVTTTNGYQGTIQTKLIKSVLDVIVLQLINQESMHGYQIITKTRKLFGVPFGPSTIYPLLSTLEKTGYISSAWNTTSEKPRKIFTITPTGKSALIDSTHFHTKLCQSLFTHQTDEP